ncbi:hypothetical protein ACF0H5_010451 [Mactra antiquata]
MWSQLAVLTLVVLCQVCYADDVHLPYYKPVTLSCDIDQYNITDVPSIDTRYWLIPNGELISEQSHTDNLHFNQNFSLSINKIDDEDFGYYYCILVRSDKTVDTIRHAVNVNGADFGNLLEKYRKNAITGGIAAGVLFVIVTGFCFVWRLRYQRKDQRNRAVNELDKAIDGYDLKAYDNVGFNGEATQTHNQGATAAETELKDDKM